MNIAQESPNGHRVLPPPCSIENPSEINPADLATNKASNNSNPSSVQIDTNPLPERCQFDHPTRMVVPSNEPQRGISPEPLPDRCQFKFSDGRQCTMARSDIHPSLCRFHSEREDQLFGDPAPGGYVVGRALDLPELYSACRDLTTAAGVNRALGQVFRLLAQRRISRQEAATFGHLAQLLLRTISAMRAEFVSAPADQESPQIEQPSHAVLDRQKCVSSPAATNGRKPAPAATMNSSLEPSAPSAPAELPTTQAAPPPASTEQLPSTSTPGEPNSRRMSSYENVGLKPVQNEHLQKNGPGAIAAERHPRRECLPTG